MCYSWSEFSINQIGSVSIASVRPQRDKKPVQHSVSDGSGLRWSKMVKEG
jgi:hypothetical protein